MGYIYKITNDINDKVYIGKTEFNIEKRFQEHCRDALKDRNEKRPLYNAMNKYGIEHFKIEEIEQCNDIENIEKYCIEYYDSYNNGYNATLGGDEKTLINYDLVVEKFKKGMTITEISNELHHDIGQLSKILKVKGITSEEIKDQSKTQRKSLIMLDKKTLQEIKSFNSVAEAAQYCIDNQLSKDTINGISAHISQCCNGIRKTAYKYKWKYIGG